jgi:hypothetical protein
VPLNAAGKLTIIASSDLKWLGEKDGTPVAYNWVPVTTLPLLLPWLVLLGLLTLKPNRRAAAWLILLPLGCVVAFASAPSGILFPGVNFLMDVVTAFGAGLAAVWLLSTYLDQKHRLISFLLILIVFAGFGFFTLLAQQDRIFATETLVAGLVLFAGVLVSSGALSLSGLICRNRNRPVGFYVWILVLLFAMWFVITMPFFLLAKISSGGTLPWGTFFGPVFIMITLNFATMLPFLVLSSASPFFRERLQSLLGMKLETPPPTGLSSGANLTT